MGCWSAAKSSHFKNLYVHNIHLWMTYFWQIYLCHVFFVRCVSLLSYYLSIICQVCMIFVFSCILEFIVVTAHIRSGKKNRGEMVIIFLLLFIIPHLSLILIYTKLKRRVSLKNKLFSHHHGHKDPILQVLENLPNITRLALISVPL